MKLIISDVDSSMLNISGETIVYDVSNDIKPCVGCFGCWCKTPGVFVIHDGYENLGRDWGKCTEMIIISKCTYGSVSPFVKNVQDRSISYMHPNFVMRNKEMHHKRRYDNVIKVSAYFYGENISDDEKETALKIINGNVDNYDGILSKVVFVKTVDELRRITI